MMQPRAAWLPLLALGIPLLAATASGRQPRRACANEPAGLTRISDEGWRVLPPDLPRHTASLWAVDRGRPSLRIVADSTAPMSAPYVVEGRFPRGLRGGTDPFSIAHDFPGPPRTTVYQCFTVRHSPNFTHNGNMSTKMGFYRGEGTNHGWRFGSHDYGTRRLFFEFFLQEGAGYRDFFSAYAAEPPGQWRQFELLVEGNDAGRANGRLRVWADHRLILDARDVGYWRADQRPGFRGLAFEPTYGGGTNPAPFDMYIWVDHWRVSVNP